MSASTRWKSCSVCAGKLEFGCTYYVCSVTSCNKKRAQWKFCSVECWEEHHLKFGHRSSAGAVEEFGPTFEEWEERYPEGERPNLPDPIIVTRKPSSHGEAVESSGEIPAISRVSSRPSTVPTGEESGPRSPKVVGWSKVRPRLENPIPAYRGQNAMAAAILLDAQKVATFVEQQHGLEISRTAVDALLGELRLIVEIAAQGAHAAGRGVITAGDFAFLADDDSSLRGSGD